MPKSLSDPDGMLPPSIGLLLFRVEIMRWSFNHVMLNGWSPKLLEHINCVRKPSVMSFSKLNGDMRGGTIQENRQMGGCSLFCLLYRLGFISHHIFVKTLSSITVHLIHLKSVWYCACVCALICSCNLCVCAYFICSWFFAFRPNHVLVSWILLSYSHPRDQRCFIYILQNLKKNLFPLHLQIEWMIGVQKFKHIYMQKHMRHHAITIITFVFLHNCY